MASNSNTSVNASTGDGLVGALFSAFKNPDVVSSLVEALKTEICKEMYGRRNGVRLHGIPEKSAENTDEIVMKIAREIGADIPDMALSRSHRVGPKQQGKPRPIIAKFIGHNYKTRLLKNKNKLRGSTPPIFLKEDLTKTRANLAKRARNLKKDGKISDTWTRDGVIFVKHKNEKVERLTKTVK
jgi:hypothetical protein